MHSDAGHRSIADTDIPNSDPFRAFIETRARIPGHRIVTTAELKDRALSELMPVRPLPSRLDPTRHGLALFEDRAPKLSEMMRQCWYALGYQCRLLTQIIEHYRIDLVKNHSIITRKAASELRQEGLF